MASEFSVDGIVAGLAKVSDEIKREVGALIPIAAQKMLSTIEGRYPRSAINTPSHVHMKDDGHIRTVQSQDFRLPIRKVVGPRLAYIWQNGTRQRTDATRGNANRGRMPAFAPDFFERTAVTIRHDMLRRAQAILDKPHDIPTTGGPGGSLL